MLDLYNSYHICFQFGFQASSPDSSAQSTPVHRPLPSPHSRSSKSHNKPPTLLDLPDHHVPPNTPVDTPDVSAGKYQVTLAT